MAQIIDRQGSDSNFAIDTLVKMSGQKRSGGNWLEKEGFRARKN